MRLPAELRSVSEARSALTELVGGWGCPDELVSDARIVLSELMSNGVLHARTELQLVLLPRPEGGVRIEVHDLSPSPVLPPLPASQVASNLLYRPGDAGDGPSHNDLPTTGRGLAVVSALSASWGWFPDAGGGKTVWADLGPEEQQPPQYAELGPFPVRPVRLIAAPVRLIRESEDHFDDLFRELQMAHLATVPLGAAASLAYTAEQVRGRLARMRDPLRRALWEALRRGDRLLDINLLADTGMPAVFEMTERLLVEASVGARKGWLLTEGPGREVNQWRRWLRGEFERQIAGKAPRACPFPVSSPLSPKMGARWDVLDAARLRVLGEISAVLSAPWAGEGERLEAVLQKTAASLGASRCALNVLDDDNVSVRFEAQVGFSSVVTAYWQTFSLSTDVPSSEVIRTAKPALFRTFAEMDERYPVFLSAPSESDPAVACIPLVPKGSTAAIGSFVIGFAQARDFIPTEVSFMEKIAEALADFLAAQRREDSSARALRRGEALEAAFASISGARDNYLMVEEFLDALVRLVVDAAAVHLVDTNGKPHFLAARHRDPERQPLAHALLGRQRSGRAEHDMVATCARTGETTVIQVLSEEMVQAGAQDAEAYEMIRKLSIGSVAVVPLRSRGHLVGVLSIAKGPGRYITDEDLAATSELADHLGETLARTAG